MGTRVDREVLQLVTEAGSFFANLDKAIAKGESLQSTFAKASTGAKKMSGEWKALGASLDSSRQPLDRFQSGLSGTLGLTKQFFGAIGIGLSAGAILTFANHTLEAAGQIKDLGDKLDISYAAAQRFKFAADQTGSSIEGVEKALGFMNRQLGAGGTGTKQALKDVGLEFESIRRMKGEDAFLAIVTAIQKIPDPMKQADLAFKLLGKSGTELLPAIREGFGDLAASAKVMSDETVKRLADAQDKLDEFKTNLTIWSGELLATMMRDASAARKGWGYFFDDLAASMKGAGKGFLDGGISGGVSAGIKAHQEYLDSLAKVLAAERTATAEREKAEAAKKGKGGTVVGGAGEPSAEQKAYNRAVRELAADLSGKKLAEEVRKLSDSLAMAGGAAQLSVPKYKSLVEQIDELAAAGAKLTPSLEKIKNAPRFIWDFPKGPKGLEDIAKLFEVPKFTNWNDLTIGGGITFTPEFALLMEQAKNPVNEILYEIDFGFTDEQRWANFNKWLADITAAPPENPVVKVFRDIAGEFPTRLSEALLHGQGIRQAFQSLAAEFAASISKAMLGTSVKGIFSGGFGKQWQGLFGNKAGGAIANMSGAIGSMGLNQILTNGGGKGMMSNVGSYAAAGMMFGPWGAAVGAGIGAIVGAFKGAANDTKKARESFAKEQGYGSLGDLYKALQASGKAGADLAHTGTAIIGKKDEAANKKWMEDVLALLGKQKDELRQLNPTWEELIELANQYGISVDALGRTTQQAQLGKQANDAVLAFKKFMAAGASMHGVLIGMQDELQGMVTQALRFNLEVPEAMRPMLEQLLEMGLLTDENGEKLKDLSRIQFSRTLQESIQNLIDKLDAFIARLVGGVPGALARLGIAPGAGGSVGVGDGGDMGPPRMPRQLDDFGSVDHYAVGTRGHYLGSDRLAQLHAGEAVLPRGGVSPLARDIASELAPIIGGAGAGKNLTIHTAVFVGGQKVDDYIVETNTKALERNDSAGAPVSHRMRVQKALGVT